MATPSAPVGIDALSAALYMSRCRDSKLNPSRAAMHRFQAQVQAEHKSTTTADAPIRLRNLGLGPRAGAVLARYLTTPVELNLHGNGSLGDEGAQQVLSLLESKTVAKVDLGACGLGAGFSTAFARHVLRCPDLGAALTHLELGGPSTGVMRPNELRQVPALLLVLQQHFPKLRQLGLSHNALGGAADASQTVHALAALGCASGAFAHLDLARNGFGELLQPLLQVLPLCAALTELDVSGNGLGDAGATLLASAITARSLADVTADLSGTVAAIAANAVQRDGSKRRLQSARALCHLAVVRAADNGIGAQGAQALGDALRDCHTLRALLLQDNGVGDEGASFLASALTSNRLLQELHLGGNGLGQPGASALANALRDNRGLLMLRLPRNAVQDDGCKALAGALQLNATLRLLDLSGCRVGDAGAVGLAKCLGGNSTLRTLKLHDNQMSERGGRQLLERLQAHMDADGQRGAAIGGLYSLTLQGNQVSYGTMEGIKRVCDGRRKHDAVPHAVHEQILTLKPAVPALELKSTQLGVEELYDQRAVAAAAELRAEIRRVQAEIDKACAESESALRKARELEAKWLREAQHCREEQAAATAKYAGERAKVNDELVDLQRRRLQLEAIDKSEGATRAAAPSADGGGGGGGEEGAADWTPLDAGLQALVQEEGSVRRKIEEVTMRRKMAIARKQWADRQLVTLDGAMAKAMAKGKKGKKRKPAGGRK